MELTEIVEALLFATQEPLDAKEIATAIKATVKEREEEQFEPFKKVNGKMVTAAIEELIEKYKETGRAFTLVERPAGWRIYARPEYADWIRSLMPAKKGSRLSPPAMETLAIIAYRQPITKAHIESVRGVAVDGVLQTLMDRNLVRIAGRADLPGRPLLYETSELFLEYFGIKELDDLPNSAELRRAPLPEPAKPEVAAPTEEQLSMSNLENGKNEKKDDGESAPAEEGEQADQAESESEAVVEEEASDADSAEETAETEDKPETAEAEGDADDAAESTDTEQGAEDQNEKANA